MTRNVTWPPWAVTSLERQLDMLSEAISNPADRTDDEQMWLTRFLVVRAVGYLEQVVHETTRGHLEQRTGGTGRSFALSWFTHSRNPSPERLLETVGRFDYAMQTELIELLDADDGYIRRELSLLVGRRHQIAHGLGEGMTSKKALDLVGVVKEVADWFIRAFNPDSARPQRAVRPG